jgi:hypothetical protein
MKTYLLAFLLATATLADYKIEPAPSLPPDLSPAFGTLLQKEGVKVVGENGVFAELWLRSSAPSGSGVEAPGVSLPSVPHGAFLGVIRFPANGADRRGQSIKPGVYTLRYSHLPQDGDHLGVAPNLDFAVMVPAAIDKDPAANPKFDELMNMSRKASGTPHPVVLSLSAPSQASAAPAIAKEGEHDWVVSTKIGELPLAITVVGQAGH